MVKKFYLFRFQTSPNGSHKNLGMSLELLKLTLAS